MRRISSPSAGSLCFRTNADGDILLRPEWIELLEAIRNQGEWIVQSRHPFARLFGRGSLPDWQISPDQQVALDPASGLQLTIGRWHHAVARLRFCNCCDSPGYVEFYNSAGQSVLQFRAPDERTVSQLAEIPAAFSTTSGLAPVHLPRGTPTLFPILDGGVGDRQPAEILLPLLESLRAISEPVRFRLLTAESDHRRTLTPRYFGEDEGVLTVSDGDHQCCQLMLPVAHSVVREVRAEAPLIHVVAADNAVLLSLAPGGAQFAHRAWHSVLGQFFPQTTQP